MNVKFILLLCIVCFGCAVTAIGQRYVITGTVYEKNTNDILPGATVIITGTDSSKQHTIANEKGAFTTAPLLRGNYLLEITFLGFEKYSIPVQITDSNKKLGKIYLRPSANALNEVKIVEKILAIVQKDDTTEYNAGAYKTNPDASAGDMVKKMPGVELNGTEVKAQGEKVTKVIVDGKPFFGNDPYATLNNLPADIIDKVQVYNEKSEQEQFTGFNEGQTTKTINIVTKRNKRHGTFGKASVAGGADNDNNKYFVGGNMHRFNGDDRVSLTLQTNNINVQNFSDQNAQGVPQAEGEGRAQIHAGGINYSGKMGKKIDVSGSYFFNENNNTSFRDTRRQYILTTDSGQVYNENSDNNSTNYSHRFNARINYNIDTANSILLQPQLSIQKNNNNSLVNAVTIQADSLLNATNNSTELNSIGLYFSNNVLFRHKFRKKRRTFSASVTTAFNKNDGIHLLHADNVFYANTALNDTLNQKGNSLLNTSTINCNLIYTEPIRKNGRLQIQYSINDAESKNDKKTYNYSDALNAYSVLDTNLSNTFSGSNVQHKAGGSYQYQQKKYELSVGLYYQMSILYNQQELPYARSLTHSFKNILPIASFIYKINVNKNIHINYNTSTSIPSINQLQEVVNNSNPLQLSTGNTSLRQPYIHNITVRYKGVNITRNTNLSVMVNANVAQDNIANSTIIALHDTMVRQNIFLPQGSVLTMPININGFWNVSSNVSYGLPVKIIKCNLNININAAISHVPGIINNVMSYDEKKTANIGVNLNSNVSEYVDFSISSNTGIYDDVNKLNPGLNNTYISQTSNLKFNWLSKSGFVFNAELTYQANVGNANGFNRDYTLCNMGIGHKLFAKHMGEIRLSVYDAFNENNSIQHAVTDTYISDMRSTVLQRYFMLTFTYKIRNFKG